MRAKQQRGGEEAGVPGLYVFRRAIPAEAEAALLRSIHNSPQPWTQRRTRASLDFGPFYKYTTVETSDARYRVTDGVVRHTPLPAFLHCEVLPLVKKACAHLAEFADFDPNQMHVASYDPGKDGRIHLHNDNKMGKLGPLIVGLCLKAGCKMTFSRPSDGKTKLVSLPRRCIYVMTGKAHREWRHGIYAHNVRRARISITLRDVRQLNITEGEVSVQRSRFPPGSDSVGGICNRRSGHSSVPSLPSSPHTGSI
jgi:alkylated DNA repair dioxygenase AlkB